MSIITTAQAVPSRLYSIYASLFDSTNGESKERLEAWSTPPSLSSRGGNEDGDAATTLFSNTLVEARRLGLIEEVGDKLRIATDARGDRGKRRESEGQFHEYLLRTLFDPMRAEETQQRGFMLALSWFLTLSPLVPLGFADAPQNKLNEELGGQYDKTELTNVNRYQNFLYWARYLGFATMVGGRGADDGKDARYAFPDPLRAIEYALPAIFAKEAELLIGTFMERLAAIFPVFEGGTVRNEINLMSGSLPSESDQKLSPATSVALQRLQDRQRIVMNSRADAPIAILDFGVRKSRVSHITVKGAK